MSHPQKMFFPSPNTVLAEDALPNPMAPAPPKAKQGRGGRAPSTKKDKKQEQSQSERETTSSVAPVTQAMLPLVSPMSGYPPPPPATTQRVPLPSTAPIEDNEREVPHFPGVEAIGVAGNEATSNNSGLHLPQDISGGENIIDYGGNHEQGSGGEQAEYACKHSGNFDNDPGNYKGEYNSFYGGGYRGRGGYGGGGYGGYGIGSYGYGYGGGGYGGRGGGYGGGGYGGRGYGGGGYRGGGGGGYGGGGGGGGDGGGGYAGDYAHGYREGHTGNYGGSHGGGAEGEGYMGGYARQGFQDVQEDSKGSYGGSYLGNEDSGRAFGRGYGENFVGGYKRHEGALVGNQRNIDSNNAGEQEGHIPSSSEDRMETTGGTEINTTNSVSSDTEILKKRKRYIPKPPNPEILKRHGQSQRDMVEENWEEEEQAEFEHDPEADNDEDEDDENDEADYEEDEATTNSREYKRKLFLP
ncbi:hypothetical protein F5879DRAFT_996457 [Lentinula edodes]|nr:hypothetical protein F5879DRAFT_996457 [Lentinula edodes]